MGYFAIYVLVAIVVFMLLACANYYAFYRKHTVEEYVEYDFVDDCAVMIVASVLWPLTISLILLYLIFLYSMKGLVKVIDYIIDDIKGVKK